MPRSGGYAIWSSPEGGQLERDSFSCGHCNRVCFVRPRTASNGKATVPLPGTPPLPKEFDGLNGGLCHVCWQMICGPCADKDTCVPLERKLEAAERASRFGRVIDNPDLKL